jgi:radical SAM superfamily enzyme YgiQ (UPF0313 family)
MYDIVIVHVPYTHIAVPPLAPAVLKGAAESEGFTVKTMDLGMDLYRACNYDRKYFDHIQNYFISTDSDMFSDSDIEFINNFVDDSAYMLTSIPSRYIGISIFSYFGHYFTYLLLTKIKEFSPDKQIVLGGGGAGTPPNPVLTISAKLSSIEKMLSFGKFMQKRKLSNHMLLGDGEEILIEFLRKNNIPNKRYVVNYKNTELAFANFDDYDLFKYPGQLNNRTVPQIPIFGSKGCVRKCDFCDVQSIQGRFRFRLGSNIVNEILYLADKYGIRDFNFTDSLVNGSLSSFMEWVSKLAEYNRNNHDKKITWNGSYICRPIGEMPEKYYKLIAESGCASLTTGFESGSDSVLRAMVKKTNTAAYRYEIAKLAENDIKVMGLLIIGHWAEHWEDFLQTCDFIYHMVPYCRNGKMIGINVGSTGLITADTPADMNRDENHLESESMHMWWTKDNPGLTFKERYFRILLIIRLCKDLKVPIVENMIPYLYTVVDKSREQAEKFYGTRAHGQTSLAESAYLNYDKFLQIVVDRTPGQTIQFEIEFESSVVNQQPKIEIKFNDAVVFDSPVSGVYKFDLTSMAENNLDIRFYGKNPRDTIINDGKIIKDTFVLIKSFVINGISLLDDADFYYKELSYTENGQFTTAKSGFWIDESVLHFTFTNPFFLDYAQRSNRNAEYGGKIISESTLTPDYYEVDDQVYLDKIIKILQSLSC